MASASSVLARRVKQGGLSYVEQFLGLRPNQAKVGDAKASDVVFVSLDFELSADREELRSPTNEAVITQLGFASLDTRKMPTFSASSSLKSLMSFKMYRAGVLPMTKLVARQNQRPCLFAHTQHISAESVRSMIVQNVCIRDDSGSKATKGQLRPIVLVGHSIRSDLNVLKYLGIDVSSIAPIVGIIDTHWLARFVFPSGEKNSLMGVLAQLGHRPHADTFHNAGNDAVYSMLAMLLLAAKTGVARKAELGSRELQHLDAVQVAAAQIMKRCPPPSTQPKKPSGRLTVSAKKRARRVRKANEESKIRIVATGVFSILFLLMAWGGNVPTFDTA